MTSKITINKEKFNKLKQALVEASGACLKVGFFDGQKANNSKLTLATIAKINEYGNKKIPSRPFMRQALIKNNNFKSQLEEAFKNIINLKMGFRPALRKVGVIAMQEMQKQFTDGNFKENSKRTVQKKKSSRPLIDKGQLRRSVSWRVEK